MQQQRPRAARNKINKYNFEKHMEKISNFCHTLSSIGTSTFSLKKSDFTLLGIV